MPMKYYIIHITVDSKEQVYLKSQTEQMQRRVLCNGKMAAFIIQPKFPKEDVPTPKKVLTLVYADDSNRRIRERPSAIYNAKTAKTTAKRPANDGAATANPASDFLVGADAGLLAELGATGVFVAIIELELNFSAPLVMTSAL